MGTLRESLRREPAELRFGTSGRRGLVADLTDLEVYINSLAELEYLQSLPRTEGGIVRGEEFFFATDLRPSSLAIARALMTAMRDSGMEPVNMGSIPTPALAAYAWMRGRGSIMVTGSHIPFDRNGYKLNTSTGELLKADEEPVNAHVRDVRTRIYGEPSETSIFNQDGQFKAGGAPLPNERDDARRAYIDRYVQFFGTSSLGGMRVLFYEHSAVGRDIGPEILKRLGARVVRAGRSDTFVPIDTENIEASQLAAIEGLIEEHGAVDAVVSTDGDSDRPLVLAPDCVTGRIRFFGGDLVGMVVAEYLGADAVVVPVSANDGIDRGSLRKVLEPKTKIGSPYVIAGMNEARRKGKRRVCGWEANGGFLTGSDIERGGAVLRALPTRDAMLPILCILFAAKEQGVGVAELFARLPKRFSRAALLKNFPRGMGMRIAALTGDLSRFFPRQAGFGEIVRTDYTDGLRLWFDNGDVAHIRPSGNADELRIYAVADTEERAEAIVAMGIAEPDGILRRLERFVQ